MNGAFSCIKWIVMAVPLLPSLHGLLAHLDQARPGCAVREVADGSDGVVGVFPGKSTGLLDTVALVDDFTGLQITISIKL